MRARGRNHLEQILQPPARSVLILPRDLKACPELPHLPKARTSLWVGKLCLPSAAEQPCCMGRDFRRGADPVHWQDFQSKGFMGCSLHLLPGIVHKKHRESPGLQILSRKIGKAQSKLYPGENHANNHSTRLNVLGSY